MNTFPKRIAAVSILFFIGLFLFVVYMSYATNGAEQQMLKLIADIRMQSELDEVEKGEKQLLAIS